jgi:hypothetical protein
VGEIWCCGQHVVMRGATIACDACGTAVERVNGEWRVARVRGMEIAGDVCLRLPSQLLKR